MDFQDKAGRRSVVFVSSDGRARLQAEASRMREIRSRAEPPASCGVDMPCAPARGPVQTFQPVQMRPKGAADWAPQPMGYRGRDALRRADAFDVMAVQALRRGGSHEMFTAGQVSIARDYAALVERVDAGGVRCSSLEARSGSGSGGEFMDAYLGDSQRLAMLRRAIGDGYAMEPQRVAPLAGRRLAIKLRRLVDLVCLRQWTMNDVLQGFGWSRATKNRVILRDALCSALDRMQGYRDG